MILYNVTLNVDTDIEAEWLTWMTEVHVPEVLATGCFSEARMGELHVNEAQGKTYTIQYTAPDMETYEKYSRDFAPALQAKSHVRYGEKVLAFRSLISVLTHFYPM
jgi:hypothetical protein